MSFLFPRQCGEEAGSLSLLRWPGGWGQLGAAGGRAASEAWAEHLQNKNYFLNSLDLFSFVRTTAATHFNLHLNVLLFKKSIIKSIILFSSAYENHHLSKLPLKRMEFKMKKKKTTTTALNSKWAV